MGLAMSQFILKLGSAFIQVSLRLSFCGGMAAEPAVSCVRISNTLTHPLRSKYLGEREIGRKPRGESAILNAGGGRGSRIEDAMFEISLELLWGAKSPLSNWRCSEWDPEILPSVAMRGAWGTHHCAEWKVHRRIGILGGYDRRVS